MAHFQRIGLLGNLNVPEVKESLHKLETFLISQGRDVIYEEQNWSTGPWPRYFPLNNFRVLLIWVL